MEIKKPKTYKEWKISNHLTHSQIQHHNLFSMYFENEIWVVSVEEIKQNNIWPAPVGRIRETIRSDYEPLEIEVFERLDSPNINQSQLFNLSETKRLIRFVPYDPGFNIVNEFVIYGGWVSRYTLNREYFENRRNIEPIAEIMLNFDGWEISI